MKRILLSIVLCAAFTCAVHAQSDAYYKAMKPLVDSVQAVRYGTDLLPYANQFERIAAAESHQWLPNYWAAYCYMLHSYAEKDSDKRDAYLDKADSFVAAIDKLQEKNEEVYVLKANIANARLAVNPQIRWMTYGGTVKKNLGAAFRINEHNPRAKLLEAQGIFYTPEAFGGGKDKALPLLRDAEHKFSMFKPSSDMMPNWGAGTVAYLLAEAHK